MNSPIHVTFRDLRPDMAVEEAILKRVRKLERLCDRITSVEVHISLPHRRHHKGRLFQVDVVVGIPGGPLVFSRHPAEHREHEKLLTAVGDAFKAVQRGVAEHVRLKNTTFRRAVVA